MPRVRDSRGQRHSDCHEPQHLETMSTPELVDSAAIWGHPANRSQPSRQEAAGMMMDIALQHIDHVPGEVICKMYNNSAHFIYTTIHNMYLCLRV